MKCPHADCTTEEFAYATSPAYPEAVPGEGDVGVCYTCGGWWQIKEGVTVKYTPTPEELQYTSREMGSSRDRFRAWAKTPEGRRAYAEHKRRKGK